MTYFHPFQFCPQSGSLSLWVSLSLLRSRKAKKERFLWEFQHQFSVLRRCCVKMNECQFAMKCNCSSALEPAKNTSWPHLQCCSEFCMCTAVLKKVTLNQNRSSLSPSKTRWLRSKLAKKESLLMCTGQDIGVFPTVQHASKWVKVALRWRRPRRKTCSRSECHEMMRVFCYAWQGMGLKHTLVRRKIWGVSYFNWATLFIPSKKCHPPF